MITSFMMTRMARAGFAISMVLTVGCAVHHPATGMTFPKRIDSFSRTAVIRYDPAGEDMSFAYNYFRFAAWTEVVISFYIYPAAKYTEATSAASPEDLETRAYEAAKANVLGAYSDARTIEEGEFAFRMNGKTETGRRGLFRYAHRFGLSRQNLQSELIVFVRGEYALKYRITYPARSAAKHEERIQEFMKSLRWPELDVEETPRGGSAS